MQAKAGDLVRMPMGVPHAYYNNAAVPARALFWVSPAGNLRQLFDALHNLTDIGEVVRLSKLHDVDFLLHRGEKQARLLTSRAGWVVARVDLAASFRSIQVKVANAATPTGSNARSRFRFARFVYLT